MNDAQSSITTSEFTDLYVSDSFAEVKGLAGVNDTYMPAPKSWDSELQDIRKLCAAAQQQSGGPEFNIRFGDATFRVTHLETEGDGGTYVLRQRKAGIRKFHELGIPKHFADAIVAPNAVGLILFCGGFGAGKTSTGESWIVERLLNHGGIALTIEDPIETTVHGKHGTGRAISINASRHNGGFYEHLMRGLRSGVDFMFLGEIRDADTASQVLSAGSNGELIAATFHAMGIPEALERLIATAATPSAANLLADSLLGVIWQDLTVVVKDDKTQFKRFTSQTLLVRGDSAVREKIRKGNIASLQQEIDQQGKRGIWGNQN
ncbi:ATPase, T2SS/T4P/T4SS family [Pseudomonas viridiflava]|uniref:ATPase, T2SS/T4P/T4SS family n=1 Tax=Pseudomonas viridiflava TaxID=33069 RepID=UPI000F03862E|nr:ATPase, T2SS/T4P/T4SS family [Pseudomonas viridiflava]